MRGKKSKLKVKNGRDEKMNWRGGHCDLYGNFIDGFTDGYKKKYYFNLVRRWRFKNPSVIFEFRTNIFNYPPYFSLSVGNSVGKLTQSEMHLMHRPLEFTQSVGDLVGNITCRQMTDGLNSVGKCVSDCGISSDYFRTLCEMLMDLIPSVCTSVILVFQVITFELSVKCRQTLFCRYVHQ
jgi:hypothetical protein